MTKPILLVEDSDDDARLLSLVFRKAGITNQIITAPNGKEAIWYLKGEGAYADRDRFPMPDVVLLDLKLPGISGFDVLEWVIWQSSLRKILIIVISGHSEIFQVKLAYALGAHLFLTKPINEEDVANLTKAFKEYWTISSHDMTVG